MSIYSTKYRLSSCKVNRNLLLEIEAYILQEAEKYLAGSGGLKEKINFDAMKKEMYHVHLQGNDGAVRYESIKELESGKLPDGTTNIILDFSSLSDQFLHIKVNFHSSISEHPAAEVSVSDLNGREISKQIAEGIKTIVKKSRNYNNIFHNRLLQIGLLFLYAFYWLVKFVIMEYTRWDEPLSLAYNILFAEVFSMVII